MKCRCFDQLTGYFFKVYNRQVWAPLRTSPNDAQKGEIAATILSLGIVVWSPPLVLHWWRKMKFAARNPKITSLNLGVVN